MGGYCWEWTEVDNEIHYDGPDERQLHPFGIYVSNIQLTEGYVLVHARLDDHSDTAARILVGYRSPTEKYYSIGLGGYGFGYVLSEFDPASGWRGTSLAGSAENLRSGHDYELEAIISGQRLQLSVDGVRVFTAVLDAPLNTGQVGLFAWGRNTVTFSNASYTSRAGKAFVVMQFTSPYQKLYTEVIRPVTHEFGFDAYHAGEVYGPGIILQDIVQGIIESKHAYPVGEQ